MRKILLIIITIGFAVSGAYGQDKSSPYVPVSQKLKADKELLQLKDNFIELSQEQKVQVLQVKNKRRDITTDKSVKEIKDVRNDERFSKKPAEMNLEVGKERTVFTAHDASKLALTEKIAKLRKNIAKLEVIEKQHNLKSTAASNYLCGKMNDTVINYSWIDAQWVPKSRMLVTFNDAGKIDKILYQDYNDDDDTWENDERYTYVYDVNYNLTSETYAFVDSGDTTWTNVEMTSYTYDASNNMLTMADRVWDGEAWMSADSALFTYDANGNILSELSLTYITEWEVNFFDEYTYNSSNQKTSETWNMEIHDGSFVPYVYIVFDVKGWDINETDYAYDDGLVSEYYEKSSYDSASADFLMGYRELYTYLSVSYYVYDESVDYGDLINAYTYQEYDEGSWVDVQHIIYEAYDMYGLPTQVVNQDSAGGSLVNYERERYDYDYAFDCNGELVGAYYLEIEFDIWGGTAWLQYYKETYEPTYFDPLEYFYLTWDADSGKFLDDDGYGWEIYTWVYNVDLYSPVQYVNLDWDYDSQDWINSYHWEQTHGRIYGGMGSFGDDMNYQLEKIWDADSSVWYVTAFDTTYYNAEGYPIEFLSQENDTNSFRYTVVYDTSDKKATTYLELLWDGSAWANYYQELMEYDTSGMTSYTSQDWDIVGSEWVNYERITTTYKTASYVETYQEWDGADWYNTERIEWGDDWDIWEVWNDADTTWEYTEWWFDQIFEWWWGYIGRTPEYYWPQNYTHGLKLWNATEERWEYQYYYYYNYDAPLMCLPFVLFDRLEMLPNNADGEFLVNEERETNDFFAYACYDHPQTEYLLEEWNQSNQTWIAVEKASYTIEMDDDCGYDITKAEEYVWSDANGIWLRTGGYESKEVYEEFGDDSLLVEEWDKSWSSGVVSGERTTWTYTTDGYLTTVIEQYWAQNSWNNSTKSVYTWSGIAELDIWDVDFTDVDCYGASTGAIDIEVRGGTRPYTYAWSNGSTTEDLSNVPAGSYSVTITDANACTHQSPYATIEQNLGIAATITYQGASTPHDQPNPGINGWAQASVSGGIPPYTYLWSDWVGTTTALMTDVKEGTYSLLVTDALGCTRTFTVYIPGDGSQGTGIEDMRSGLYAIYPNPSNGNVILALNHQFKDVFISVYNIKGQLVFNDEIAGAISDGFIREFDLSKLENGTYLFKVHSQGISFDRILIIQK